MTKKQLKAMPGNHGIATTENREVIQELREIKSDIREVKKFLIINKLAEKDKKRNKEIAEWDRIQEEDEKNLTKVRRGEVYLIRFDPLKKGKFKKVVKNTEIKDPHPAVAISNDIQNQKNSRITVVPLTHTLKPFYESWEVYSNFNHQKGKVMCDQVKNIDKKRIIKHLGKLDPKTMKEVESKILDSLELIKSLANEQLLLELARRIKDKEID
ncbi:18152_t:CDS:2 [Gigaspora margarita]|uniref:18152_t:CDS:1 n=1 Tax=Gigaspora margarita TaxID=4874 RepID=A0ABN7VUA9_GIGMA|nr:18152_t:CDS:2 [Gigaspora margarita]